jgi:ABC-2 type transport system ATP-binding protein
MRQKVAIALAVVRKVPVLLLDEPTSGLDPKATADFNALLSTLKARGTAILMVTHSDEISSRFGRVERLEQLNRPKAAP